ncbi:putative magnesium transporter NIPA6 [Vitis vinifera]|uniref:Probable magnesium transporter n=1 Tax=Vitis vinifera TaxID=29760 RepID=A0A438KIU3_VITVI|nr:putative magnesium transporter NIPA6 [Vitis vinifera]
MIIAFIIGSSGYLLCGDWGWVFQVQFQTNFHSMEMALDTFNTAVVSPIYYALFTSFTILASVIMFKDWSGLSASSIVSELCGFITVLSGTAILHSTREPDPPFITGSSIRNRVPGHMQLAEFSLCEPLHTLRGYHPNHGPWEYATTIMLNWEIMSPCFAFWVQKIPQCLHEMPAEVKLTRTSNQRKKLVTETCLLGRVGRWLLITCCLDLYTPLSPKVSWHIQGNGEIWKPKDEDGPDFVAILRQDYFK